MKILIAVDGSDIGTRAARWAARLAGQLAEPPGLVLFNADPPLMQAVAIKLGLDEVHRYHAENGRYALRAARAALNRAHVPFEEVLVVGDPDVAILREAKKGRYDLIVMGTHGRGALQGLVMGSVARKVIAQSPVPVTVVR